MGKLFEFIKKRYEIIKEFDNLRRENFIKSRSFDTYRKAYIEYDIVRSILDNINKTCERSWGKNKFNDFVNSNNGDLGIDKDGIILPNINDDLIDIEESLNKLESELNENEINSLIESSKDIIKNKSLPPRHVFDGVINKIKADLDALAPTNEEISEEEKREIISSLDYANSVMVENRNDGIYDDIIDELSEIKKQQRIDLPEFAQKMGVTVEDIDKVDTGTDKISISFNDTKNYDKFAHFVNKKITFSEEYKNKIKALDNYISQKSIMKNLGFGEAGYKEYGFIDWFIKATELKNEIMLNQSLTNDQRAQKIASYKKIITLKNELENVTNEYKDVMNYIKSNFDVNKISFPGNIYSGRNQALRNDDLENFRLNLPEMFDIDNAGYGVLLNGYSQLKGFINTYGINLDEFLEDPLKSYFKIITDKGKEIEARIVLPREGNPLGKRIARALYQPENAFNTLTGVIMGQRSLEFLIKAEEINDDSFDKCLLDSFATSLATMQDHRSAGLFGVNRNENLEIKKLFAFGDDVDNLLTVSKNYRSLETIGKENPAEFNYENRIHEMRDTNPADECRRVLEIIKDYLTERKYLNDHMNEFCNVQDGEEFINRFEPVRLLLTAKEYFEDYIYKNDINISKISNDADRELVTDFLCDPLDVLKRKYNDNPNLFSASKHENFDKLKEEFGNAVRNRCVSNFNDFGTKFEQNNNSNPNGFNSNKDMMTIIRDNSGSKWEKFFKSTSNEYKTLIASLYSALDPDSSTYGDLSFVKYSAQKYLEHKLPAGVNEAKISETGRRRIEFCRTILKSLDALDDRFKEVSVNQPAADIQGPSLNIGNNIQNQDFQDEIKEDLDKENIEENKENDLIKIKEELNKDDIDIKDDSKEIIDIKK